MVRHVNGLEYYTSPENHFKEADSFTAQWGISRTRQTRSAAPLGLIVEAENCEKGDPYDQVEIKMNNGNSIVEERFDDGRGFLDALNVELDVKHGVFNHVETLESDKT